MTVGPYEWTEKEFGRFIKGDATAVQFELTFKDPDGDAVDRSGDDYELVVEDVSGGETKVTVDDTNWTISYSSPVTTILIPAGDIDNTTTIQRENSRARLKNTTLPKVVAQGPWFVDN
jgi:hypothetical protein